jgi:ribonuclease HI
MRPLAHIKEV